MAPPISDPRARPESIVYEKPAIAGPVNERGGEPLPLTGWWSDQVGRSLSSVTNPSSVAVRGLVVRALQNSRRIAAVQQDGVIRRTAIVEAEAEFDPTQFVESQFTRTSDPVGNTLTTGGPPRFREELWSGDVGLRKKAISGGMLEFKQGVGTQDNNSLFLVPGQQGNARMSLSFEQPLLSGAGKTYNSSLIVLAQIDADVVDSRVKTEIQDHLLRVVSAYWDLYLQRAAYLQKQRHFQRADQIYRELEGRRNLDALESQIVRARSAALSRRTELIRSGAAIRNAEAQIRALVNSADLRLQVAGELVPIEPPQIQPIAIRHEDAVVTALQNRPELKAAAEEIRAAGVRMNMSENELMPALSLVLDTYVSGLRGSNDISGSFIDQFSTGEPAYTVGLQFERSLFNRAARARVTRRRAELSKLTSQYDEIVQTLSAEVEIAVREVQTTYQEAFSEHEAMLAAGAEVDYLQVRWRRLAGVERSASALLEDVLDAQDRLAAAEFRFASAQVGYAVAVSEMKRALGTLLQIEELDPFAAALPPEVPTRMPQQVPNQLTPEVPTRLPQPPDMQSSPGFVPANGQSVPRGVNSVPAPTGSMGRNIQPAVNSMPLGTTPGPANSRAIISQRPAPTVRPYVPTLLPAF